MLSGSGEINTRDVVKGKKAIGLFFLKDLYFPDRALIKDLAKWYSTSLKAKGVKIVFVSYAKEQDDEQFQIFFQAARFEVDQDVDMESSDVEMVDMTYGMDDVSPGNYFEI